MIRSYDIFDTCLTRKVAEPAMVFDLMAERLGLGKQFRFNRQEAEREAMRRHGEATLAEIYAILGGWLGWDPDECDKMMTEELAEETQHLIPVPQIREHLEESRAAGARVVFLSDMYLPSTFLIDRLLEHKFYQEGDFLMVSCEVRKSKSSGHLFKEAIKILGAQDWEHIGNHMVTDVKEAKKAGLKASHFPQGNLTPHESRLLAWAKEGEPVGAIWAAAARQARIGLGPLNMQEHQFAAVAAGVAAPLLVTYVTWLCQRAAHHGLEKLYFLARDGQILMDLFVRIAKATGLSIKAHYLYASRIALRFPRCFPMSDEDAAGVFQANDAVPLSVVALRLGISEQELRRLLPVDCRLGESIPKRKIPACREALASPIACAFLNEVAAQRSRLLEDYLRQEGLMNGTKYGIVDLGWGGSLQAGIQKTLEGTILPAGIQGFYLGLRGLPSAELSAEAFAFDYRRIATPDVAWFITLAELFSQADHGSTLGFQSTMQGSIVPQLDELDSDHPGVPDWLDLHRCAILGFAEAVIAANALPDSPSSLIRLLRGHLRWFYFFPTKAEARVWGSCQFSSHGAASIREPLAPCPRSLKDLHWTLGIRRFGAGKAIWPHGAAARMPFLLASFSRLCLKIILRVRPLKW
jgi:FMN phosphatase YigB (HAD superfamily)